MNVFYFAIDWKHNDVVGTDDVRIVESREWKHQVDMCCSVYDHVDF